MNEVHDMYTLLLCTQILSTHTYVATFVLLQNKYYTLPDSLHMFIQLPHVVIFMGCGFHGAFLSTIYVYS